MRPRSAKLGFPFMSAPGLPLPAACFQVPAYRFRLSAPGPLLPGRSGASFGVSALPRPGASTCPSVVSRGCTRRVGGATAPGVTWFLRGRFCLVARLHRPLPGGPFCRLFYRAGGRGRARLSLLITIWLRGYTSQHFALRYLQVKDNAKGLAFRTMDTELTDGLTKLTTTETLKQLCCPTSFILLFRSAYGKPNSQSVRCA